MTCQYYMYSSQILIIILSFFNFLSITSNQEPVFTTTSKYTDQEIFNRAKIIHIEKPYERFGSCFTYAITHHLGIIGQAPQLLKINAGSDLIRYLNIVDNYYQKVDKPCEDSLIVYQKNSHEKITHFGIAQQTCTPLSECIIKSKWGFAKYILEHKLFEAPKSYGTKVSFFILKPEYQNNRSLFLKNLQAQISKSLSIQRAITENEIILLQIANQENIADMILLIYTAHRLLKECIGLSINTFNLQTKETILLLATKRNNINLIHLFLSMGADKTTTDINGYTALMIAKQNNFVDAIQLLECEDVNLLTQ